MADFYLIDGYNLIHALGMIETPHGPKSLERSRRRLLNYLGTSFTKEEATRVTIVFDAQNAPAHARRESSSRGLHVEFAPSKWSADDLIESLVAEHSAPRSLIVISNDTRIQKAARRRGSTPWTHAMLLDFFERRRAEAAPSAPSAQEDAKTPMSQKDKEHWIKEFEGMESDPEFKDFFNMDRFD